jgi:hypothetical protein
MPPSAAPDREQPPLGRQLGGCLLRFMLFIVVLLLLLAGGVFLFGRAFP